MPPRTTTVESGRLVGPWDDAFWVGVPVPLRSKSNSRRFSRADATSATKAAEHRTFVDVVASFVRRALPDGWDLGQVGGRVSARPTVVALIAGPALLDSGNVSKSVLDAAEGIVYRNDASVAHTAGMVVRRRGDGFDLAFARLAPGASPLEVFAAAGTLGSAWFAARGDTVLA